MAIDVALTFDDAFWAPAYATMRSVCLTTSRRRQIVFHLCHAGLSGAHRRELDAVTSEFGASLRDYDVGATGHIGERVAALPAMRGRRYHPIVYARLFLGELLPAGIERLVFLDCDLVVRTPIERLAEIDLGGKAMAAALEPRRIGFQTGRDLKAKRYFDTADPYFNAGVMLIDFRQWAGIDFVAAIRALVTEAELQSLFQDQDVLNIVMKDRWLVLDHRWNFQNPVIEHEPLDPFIVHYSGADKPWRLFGRSAYRRFYRHLMTNRIFYMFWRERMRRRLGLQGR